MDSDFASDAGNFSLFIPHTQVTPTNRFGQPKIIELRKCMNINHILQQRLQLPCTPAPPVPSLRTRSRPCIRPTDPLHLQSDDESAGLDPRCERRLRLRGNRDGRLRGEGRRLAHHRLERGRESVARKGRGRYRTTEGERGYRLPVREVTAP